MNCAIYTRYSSSAQNPKSCQDQLDACLLYAAKAGWTVVRVFSDAAISGTKGREGRPGWDALLSWIEGGALAGGVVLAWDWDRWSRDGYTGPIARLTIQAMGVDVADTASGVFGRDMAGQVLATVKEQGAADFINKMRRASKRGKDAKHLSGYWMGPPPFGYVIRRTDGGAVLEQQPVEAAWVLRMFREFDRGRSIEGIARMLNAAGVKTKRGGYWRGPIVRGVLTSYANGGYCARRNQPTVKGQHAGIVDEAMWRRTREAILTKPLDGKRRTTGRKYPLSGLIVCGRCGELAWINCGGYQPLHYRCKHWPTICPGAGAVHRERLERAVVDWWRSTVTPAFIREIAVREVQAEYEQALRAARERAPAEAELADIDRREQHLIALAESGGSTPLVLQRIDQLVARRQVIQAELANLGPTIQPAPIDELVAYLVDEMAAMTTPADLRPWISRITITGKNAVTIDAFDTSAELRIS